MNRPSAYELVIVIVCVPVDIEYLRSEPVERNRDISERARKNTSRRATVIETHADHFANGVVGDVDLSANARQMDYRYYTHGRRRDE